MAGQNPGCCFFLVLSPGRNPHGAARLCRLKSRGRGGFNTVSWVWLCLPAAKHCLSPLQLETLNKEMVALGGASPGLCSFGTTDIRGWAPAHGGCPAHGRVWGSSPDLH